jgi:protein-disulfide isomerase
MVTKSSPTVDSSWSATASNTITQNAIIFLVILSVLLNIFSLYFLMGYSFSVGAKGEGVSERSDDSIGIKRVLLDLEYEKVGGKENYEILQKYSQMQITEQIAQIKSYVEGTTPSVTAGTPTAEPQGTISPENLEKLIKDASIEGNKDAPILVVEYSDTECPFCMRQYHETKLFPTLLSQYTDKVAVAFKNNRGVNHKWTEAKALGALCAGKIGGDGAYQKFYKGVMDQSTNEGGVLDVSKLPDVAKAAWVDVAVWQSCVDNKETLSQFTAQTNEAQAYGLGGTPGTLIINVKTGKYATVEGAYPYATFTAKIDELLK